MKKLVALSFIFTGCAKPKGDFNLDNSTEFSMNAEWRSYDLYVSSFGYNSYSVEAGSGTVSVYANGYGYWGSMSFTVPEGGSNTLYMYWGKSTDAVKTASVSITKPVDQKKDK